jgi:hypothetical protein
MGWATFWANFSHTHLVTLSPSWPKNKSEVKNNRAVGKQSLPALGQLKSDFGRIFLQSKVLLSLHSNEIYRRLAAGKKSSSINCLEKSYEKN